MDEREGRNRRQYPRIRADAVTGIHRLDGATQRTDAIDLGLGGLRLQCPGLEVASGDIVELTISFGDRSATLKAKVVRLLNPDLLVQDVALQFIEVDSKTLEHLEELGLWEWEDESEE